MKKCRFWVLAIVLCGLIFAHEVALAATNPYPESQTYDDGSRAIPCTRVAWQEAYDRLGIALPAWGNATSWFNNAKASGYNTGTIAKVNSIACYQGVGSNAWGHVQYVVGINANGTMNCIEGGVKGKMVKQAANNVSTQIGHSDGYIKLGGVIYLGEGPVPTATFTNWENAKYTYIRETDAAIGQKVVTSGGTWTEVGMILFDADGNRLGKAHDVPSANQNYYYYKINEEFGITLKKGRIYQYQFYAFVGDAVLKSEVKQFRTAGTAEYEVRFDANGGSAPPATQIKYGNANLTLSSTKPTLAGYDFVGWATSKNATSAQYSAGGTFTTNADTTLFAVWTIAKYTVKYDANGGTGAPSEQIKTHGTNLTLSSSKPIRTGYEFLGWATSGSATTVQYPAGATFTTNANTTLYAVWRTLMFTVTYNANGGSGAPNPQTKLYGNNLTLSSMKPTREGYAFLGWGTSSIATFVDYAPGAVYTSNANATLFALWRLDSFTLKYNANGGTGTVPNPVTVKYKETVTVQLVQLTRKGYYFLGWATKANATEAQFKSGSKVTMTSDTTLFAVWKPRTNKITFNANGGTGTLPETISVLTGKNGTIGKASVSRKGYYFLGWSTSKTATAANLKTGSSISVDEDTVLYAVWKPRTNKITFNANGGTGTLPEEISVLTGKKAVIGAAKMQRAAHYFLGWATSKTATAATYKTGSEISVAQDTILYAVWKKAGTVYKITFDSNGGKGSVPAATEVAAGAGIDIPSVSLTRDGFYFIGWSTKKDAKTAEFVGGYHFTPTKDTTIYAVWKKK